MYISKQIYYTCITVNKYTIHVYNKKTNILYMYISKHIYYTCI